MPLDFVVNGWILNEFVEPAPVGCVWNTPLVCAPKADGHGGNTGTRVCADFRELNKKLVDDKFPIPKIEDIYQKVGRESTIFTTLDLKDGYHQFKIKKKDRVKTAFTWRGRQFQFTSAPFGLKHISSIFQRVMMKVIDGLDFVLFYIDDIVVFSKSVEEHIMHVEEG